jgi:predicted metalloprotease
VIELAASPSKRQPSDREGGNSNTALMVIGGIGGLIALLAVGGIAAFFMLRPSKVETGGPTPPVATSPSEPMVPAYTATDEERQLASKVPESTRVQIMQMWDAMRATTGKKLLAPKGSVVRNRVEDMLSGIEQREIVNMAALLQVEEASVRAVIQVEMADRAAQAAAEQAATE